MSDPSLVLFDAWKAAMETAADANALGAAGVRVYDIAPHNPPQGTGKPYVILDLSLEPDLAQCVDGRLAHLTADIWSLTDPPGKREAMAIAAACLDLMAPLDADNNHTAPAWSLSGFSIKSALPTLIEHLTEPADQSAHSIVRVTCAIDPA